MATKTNSGLVAYAKAQVGKPYWYGTYGQTASASLYTSKKTQYPSQYTASDFTSQYGKRVHDCVGLIKGYLWSDSTTSTPVYNSDQDKNAKGMYSAASSKGKISTLPNTPGLLVFKGDSTSQIHHVGVYDGSGYVYEAKGHAYGVTKTAYKSSEWDYWAQCPYTTDDSEESSSAASESSYTIETAASKESGHEKGTTLKTTTGLRMRTGAGTDKTIIKVLSKGTKVTWYGYYTSVSGTKWYLVVDSTGQTGFMSSKYLS